MNERQRKVLRLLKDEADYITAARIAEEVGFSVQTIRNELRQINQFLMENSFGAIVSKSNKGVKLEIAADAEAFFVEFLDGRSLVEQPLSADDDLMKVCEMLLRQRRQITMSALEAQLLESHGRVDKLLGEAEKWFEERNISLVRKRGQGIGIRCDEYTWRIVMWKLYNQLIQGGLFMKTDEQKRYMERFLNGFDTWGVVEAIRDVENKYGLKFSYDAYQRLSFLLSVTVAEIRKKRMVEISEPMEWEGQAYDWRMAADCMEQLHGYYRIQMNAAEKEFICRCFAITDIECFHDPEEETRYREANSRVYALAEKVILLSERIFQVDFREDAQLRDNLFLYLKVAICQNQSGFRKKNPLVNQIRERYPHIYVGAWSAGLLVDSEVHVEFGENEVAYLALYLGGAMERQMSDARACIVCNCGVGISQILREQLLRSVTNLEIVDVYSVREHSAIRKGKFDFIISTEQMEDTFEGKEVIRIDSILKEYDIDRIRKKVREIHKQRRRQLQKLMEGDGYRLFSPEFVFFDNEQDKERLLHRMCALLYEKGYVSSEFEASVQEREKFTSTALGKGVAIPHGLAGYVHRPLIAYIRLDQPMAWNEDADVQDIFLLALTMREEFGAKKQIIRFYSELVSMLENEEGLMRLHGLRDKEEIAGFFNGWTAEGNRK